MNINFTGVNSAADRTIFVHHGPIMKPPLPMLSGVDLYVVSPNEIEVATGGFNSQSVGKTITISGSPGGRNDGTFPILEVVNARRVRLFGASLDHCDVGMTTDALLLLANDLRARYAAHTSQPNVHGSADLTNVVAAPVATDLSSAAALLNDIKAKLTGHAADVSGNPQVHAFQDPNGHVYVQDASGLTGCILLANALRSRYEQHRQDAALHVQDDSANRMTERSVSVRAGSGPLVGPFSWVLSDPRDGEAADDPSDVSVTVNGAPASVDAVFGLLGAIVLSQKPSHGDTVLVDYRYMINAPMRFDRLNSSEFVLNQEGNLGKAGLPGHTYRQRSYLALSASSKSTQSPFVPQKVGWKYKGLERAHTAVLNDPTTLLLNVPANRMSYPTFMQTIAETSVRYDPTTLPQGASDAWTYHGSGSAALVPGGTELHVTDTGRSPSVNPGPPFFSHPIDLTFPSDVSAVFRFSVTDTTPDGDFTGVGFGVADGGKAAMVGALLTDANNASSAMAMANDIRAKYGAHVADARFHRVADTVGSVDVVEASDLPSLLTLVNRLSVLMNSHMASVGVHESVDAANDITAPPATDLRSAIDLVNLLRRSFNSHRTQVGVHASADLANVVGMVRQVGVLTSGGPPEVAESWTSFAHDWTVETTYRLHRSSGGDVGVFLSGDMSARVSVANLELPSASSAGIGLKQAHQVFFGSLGLGASNASTWRFARVDVMPITALQIGRNKSVVYTPVVVPERDATFPWIGVGQGGSERVVSSRLQIDSMASLPAPDADAAGALTGEYRGFLRLEPSLSEHNIISVEFTASTAYRSFGVDNRSLGVHISDGQFATILSFLQSNPQPGRAIGTVFEPSIVIDDGDVAVFSIDGGREIVATHAGPPITSVADVVALLNNAAGYVVATAAAGPGGNTVSIATPRAGGNHAVRIIGGQVFGKLGIQLGSYYGRDSSPEPKISWSGIAAPDGSDPAWVAAGTQAGEMYDRVLRVTDADVWNFRSYTQASRMVTGDVLSPPHDWKADFRMRVLSYVAGERVMSGPNLYFCGATMSVDEGQSGRSIELLLSSDADGAPFINVVSYNSLTESLDSVANHPFAWDDGEFHSYSIFTAKGSDIVSIFADGTLMGTVPYSSLNPGAFGPSITFGSGSNPVANVDMRRAMSVTEWTSVSAIRDSSVSDPSLSSQRYVGIYRGGDPTDLDSYYLHQIDWSAEHTYRLVRDPSTAVSVYVDGGDVPVISAGHDAITLPAASVDYMSGIAPSGKFIAFGSFNQSEICRSSWGPVRYSVGRMTAPDGSHPAYNSSNRANVVSSSEHLSSASSHQHFGTSTYSGGTPSDEFLSDDALRAATVLGDGTPPVPATRSIQVRGATTTATPLQSIPAADLVNTVGQLAYFEDDLENAVTADADATALAASLTAGLGAHVMRKPSHLKVDPSGVLAASPDVVAAANALKAAFNSHLTKAGVHCVNDSTNEVVAADAADPAEAAVLLETVRAAYEAHRTQRGVHANTVVIRLSAPSGTIFDRIRFWTHTEGTAGLTSTVSDDEGV